MTWQTSSAPFLGGGASQILGITRLNIEEPASEWQTLKDDGCGVIVLRDGQPQNPRQRFSAEMADPAEPGHGTVPAERTAQEPVRQGKARIAYQQTGYEHQDSFKDDAVMTSTLHAVCKIALQSFTWKTCS